MKTIRLLVDLEYDDESIHGGDNDKDAKFWFVNNVLYGERWLILHSNEIGDEVGTVKVKASSK